MVRIARIKLEWRICEPGPNDMPCTADIHHFSDLQVNCCLPQVLIVFGTEERLVIYCVHYIPRAQTPRVRNTDYAHTIFSAYGTASEPPLRALAAIPRALSPLPPPPPNLAPNTHP